MSNHDTTIIHREERRYQSFLETAPDAMVIADEEGRIIFVNAQTEKMFGYQRGELLEQKVEMLLPMKFRDKHPSHRSGFFREPKIRSMEPGVELYVVERITGPRERLLLGRRQLYAQTCGLRTIRPRSHATRIVLDSAERASAGESLDASLY